MASVSKVLVVGGGTVGNSVAVLLRRSGVAVDLVEVTPDWNTLGSGITLLGNALRVLREVGVWDEVSRNIVASPDLNPAMPGLGGPDLPAMCGMYRPTLQAILIGAVRASGADVRLGVSPSSLDQHSTGVDVAFSDGTTGTYDLVIGADGIRSSVRAMIGIQIQPTPTGMAIWRVHAKRPPQVEHMLIQHGGAVYIAGLNPTGPDTLYGFLVEQARDRSSLRREDMPAEMRRIAASLTGPWEAVREDITDPDRIDYRHFEHLLVDMPWHRGRVVLMGDAAHACPPTIAQGAAMGLEDASILAQMLAGDDAPFDDTLLTKFSERRYERVRTVVECSVGICDALLHPGTGEDFPTLMGRAMQTLYQPA
jgi:2-polyprenyl-6-methoxyphenol hydroxylase-like FAD-dependent oxidoreductase